MGPCVRRRVKAELDGILRFEGLHFRREAKTALRPELRTAEHANSGSKPRIFPKPASYFPLTIEQWVAAVFQVPESLIQVSLQITVRARCVPLSSAS